MFFVYGVKVNLWRDECELGPKIKSPINRFEGWAQSKMGVMNEVVC